MTSLFLALFLQPLATDLIHDRAVLDFSRVLARAAIADRTREHGAFVVRSPEGIVYFVVWPASGSKNLLRWQGAFPEGTIAILHTHPAWTPHASKLDRRAARRTKTPVYTITPETITKTIGGDSEVVATDWFDAPLRTTDAGFVRQQ